ncbi:OmpA family protein [Methylotuvimicrobium alcaliphilum]|uniref:OmpA/MotB domain protein n=1 Tax=Methylotuvimicrobium alcaliphilum (strain DSM 19304 / NCIMB 14124 / VKM B-2133 / 20Z) TaxID=1091494 RepID=G4SX65_META2|nr:OmpA family protein [Methylotuvimicrobium alcaliphilum]CCE24221.1 OmpA/MotB domain protein [Methylotuvimicrobium alcaliphilum 20Z]
MPKQNLFAIALLAGMSMQPLVQADDHYRSDRWDDHYQDDRWYIAPFASYVDTGGDRNASNGWGGGMGFGKIIDEHFNVELKGFYEGFNGTNGAWSLTGGTADLQYYFFRDKFSPYTVVGVGGMNSCVSGNCGAGIIGEAGVGFSYELHDNLLVRSDVRYRYNNNLNAHVQPGTDEFHDMTVNVGFVIPFGDKPKTLAQRADTRVEPVAITDCATLDSDGDGVNDCLDQCPDTIKGGVVDAKGCLIRLVLKGVGFKFDSEELTPTAQGILDGVAQNLIAHPQSNDIEVQGHASSEGSHDYNMALSQRRSASVVDYLKRKGVANKLIAKGYGETQPIADNATEAGRSENRRVELIWVEE